jgi:HD-GYP domain-containing protein (c-di-GMP phosphodiesterase class II)
MYVVGLDKSWWRTPFFSHKRAIRGEEDIILFKQAGVHEVTIEVDLDYDVETPPNPHCPPEPERSGVEESCEYAQESLPDIHARQDSSAHGLIANYGLVNPQSVIRTPQLVAAALAAELPAARAARTEALAIVQSIFEGVKTGAPIDSLAVQQVVRGLLDSILRRPEASLMLMRMRQFDADLLTHAVDVCVLALVIGKERDFSTEQLGVLGVGALLHDVGQTRLPRNLQRKSRPYSTQEQKLLREHPRLGAAILAQSKEIAAESRRIVVEHHERADGSGYPAGHTATALSPLSQLVSIADTYDVLVSGRNGQPAILPTHALRHLYQLGRVQQFDREQVELAIRALGIYPVGALVELNTGEQGVVIAVHPAEALRPIVQIIHSQAESTRVEPRVVDLAVPAGGEPAQTIVRVLDPALVNSDITSYFKAGV